jgi:hypothetical protein
MTLYSSMNHSQWIRVDMRVMQIRGAFSGGESGLPSLALGTVSCTCDVCGSLLSSSCLADGAFSSGLHLCRSWDGEPISQDVGEQGWCCRRLIGCGWRLAGGVEGGGVRGGNGRLIVDRFRVKTWSAQFPQPIWL